MTYTNNNVSTDETTKTVTIRQEEFNLKTANLRKDYHHVIYATTVNVGSATNYGTNLTVYAARVLVDASGETIYVGQIPEPVREKWPGYKPGDRRDATTFKRGTHDGEDGPNGADAEKGKNGGDVTIYAGKIQGGALRISSKGGPGSRGQDGGNGKDGAQPPERGKPAMPKEVQVGVEYIDRNRQTPKYGWGDDVTKIGYERLSDAYLLVAHNANAGTDGGHGGHAGLAGKPGEGGNGGHILVSTLVEAPAVTTLLAGGLAGLTAVHGKPGAGAPAGLGAKYLYKADASLVSIDWSAYDEDDKWDKEWNTKNSTFMGFSIDQFDNLKVHSNYIVKDGDHKKLRLRNSSGKNGRSGGYGKTGEANPPPVPTAGKGADGSFKQERLDGKGEVFRSVPYAYLLMLQRSAAAALFNGDSDEAAEILRWLLLLTTPHKDARSSASEDEKNRRRIYYDSENALLTRDRDPGASARCIYKDIKLYSEFVEKSLDHVTRQTEYLTKYKKAEDKLGERKKALDDAIKEAQDRIDHLKGNTSTPGSIDYYVEKEQQLRTAISELDVQILDYKEKLEDMPTNLQSEIDAEIRKKTEITVWTALEFIGMAAGVAMNFASAAGSIKDMVSKVTDFYKETLDLTSWGQILKDGIWKREFSDIKADLSTLLDLKEWEKASKSTKELIKSATDFWGKVNAYEALAKSKGSTDFAFNILDVQASVLIFDTGKLELKKKRNEFETFIYKFIDGYEQAREWKHVFSDYFDTADTRFDMLKHLSDLQAQRRDLEYKRSLYQRNKELLVTQKDKVDFDAANFQGEDIIKTMEANLNLAFGEALIRITDEARAYKIWTLDDHTFPKLPKNPTVEDLRSNFHEPLWTKIQTALSSTNLPAHTAAANTVDEQTLDDNTFYWRREKYPQLFEMLQKKRLDDTTQKEKHRITLTIPVDDRSSVYSERITDAKVYLRGAKTRDGSPFRCVLKHAGVSGFFTRSKKVVTCYQEPRGVEFSYVVKDDAPDYHHSGAIEDPFGEHDKKVQKIRYSPYTTWEIELEPNYERRRGGTIYNRDIDLSGLKSIELRFDLYQNSFGLKSTRGRVRK